VASAEDVVAHVEEAVVDMAETVVVVAIATAEDSVAVAEDHVVAAAAAAEEVHLPVEIATVQPVMETGVVRNLRVVT